MADDSYLLHYGILRRSGRYPWGSGGTPEEDHRSFLGYVKDLEKKGVSEVDIAKGMGLDSVTQLRDMRSVARNAIQKADAALALRLQSKGMSNVAIGEHMKIAESSVRALLNPALAAKRDILQTTADLLESKIKDGSFLDIGSGTESHLGISATKLRAAVAILREKGYEVHNVQVPQLSGTGLQKTTVKVLAAPGTAYKDIVRNMDKIGSVAAYSNDGGTTYEEVRAPTNVDSKRVGVVYAEQGGGKADGVIYLRPGVDDLSLGAAKYAQVRIAVDGTHYLKGMAVYKDGLPDGTDLEFHTSKSDTGNKLDAMKKQSDEVNPFGSTIHQRDYTDASGKSHLSPINIVNEEGDWNKWSRNLSSQFLSKQPIALAKRQLDQALTEKKDELNEISHLTNAVVKKKLLDTFADSADSASVHLKAAALPSQRTQVILPIPTLKKNEIYAPNFNNGDRVVLVRHPHGGTFEIPELTVNNKHPDAKATLGNALDAVGIHPDVAARLSGADFDGDTVLVIPNNKQEVKTSAALDGLKDFDPKQAYAPYHGMPTIDGGTYDAKTHSVEYGKNADGTAKKPSGRAKQQQMGDVSNLITDMSIKGASRDELAAAVRHSMVVIDAEKHSLNYKQSAIDNGISSLKARYQGRGTSGRLSGASTIVSRAGSDIRVPERKLRRASEGGPVNPETGTKVYTETGKTYVDKQGRTVVKTSRTTKLAEALDAHSLSSGMPIEEVYSAHSNSLKALANDARKQSLHTGKLEHSPTATKTYSKEVASLNSSLNLALKNKPKERQAQLIAASAVKARVDANPGMDPADLKKIKGQELTKARARLGAQKQQIVISDDEWKAIQAGAITTKRLNDVLDNADLDRVRQLATPRAATVMTPAKLAIAESRLASGYTQAEVAQSLGIPVSTLNSAILRKGG